MAWQTEGFCWVKPWGVDWILFLRIVDELKSLQGVRKEAAGLFDMYLGRRPFSP